jgi:hypothetical protein
MPSPLRLGEQTGTVKVRLLGVGDIEPLYMRKYLPLASLDFHQLTV